MQVTFGFAGVPKVLDLEPAFNAMSAKGDWIRYAANNWILWTSWNQQQIYGMLLAYIDDADNMLIVPLDRNEVWGRMPPWVWNWMNAKNAQITSGMSLGEILALTQPKK